MIYMSFLLPGQICRTSNSTSRVIKQPTDRPTKRPSDRPTAPPTDHHSSVSTTRETQRLHDLSFRGAGGAGETCGEDVRHQSNSGFFNKGWRSQEQNGEKNTQLTRNDSIAQFRRSPVQCHRSRFGIFVDGEVSRSAFRRCFLSRVEHCHAVGTFATGAVDHLQRMAKRVSF